MPCIIHTSGKNKKEITAKTLQILEELSFPGDLAIVDHVNYQTVESVLKAGFYAGLTVQPGKLTEVEVYGIVDKFGVEKTILNSDTGFSKADMFATAKAVKYLLKNGVSKEDVKKLAFENGKGFFRLKS
jgi:hypothetical protein